MRVLQLMAGCAAVVLLAGCGGGGGVDNIEQTLSSETAQGYAADSQAMPLAASTTVQTATRALESALAAQSGTTPSGPSGPSALVALTLSCANGGTLSFSVSGGTVAQHLNGLLDAGETYQLTFNNCAGPALDDNGVLDGSLALVVTAYSPTQADLTHTANALRLTNTQGRYTLQGGVREQRSSTATGGGGQRLASHLTSSGLALQGVVAGRSSSYELRSLDWTVICTLDVSGLLVQRTHQGALTLAASTPRRPNATLQVATQGTLVASDNGLYAARGSFSLATNHDRIFVVYGSTTVMLELDLGNNGSIDRRWTLPRLGFDAEAG